MARKCVNIFTCSFCAKGIPNVTVEIIVAREEKTPGLAERHARDAADNVVVAVHAQLLVGADVKHAAGGVITAGRERVPIRKELKQTELKAKLGNNNHTVCPRSSDPFYIVTYYIEWVSTSWTDSKHNKFMALPVSYITEENNLDK